MMLAAMAGTPGGWHCADKSEALHSIIFQSILIALTACFAPAPLTGQISYVARFTLDKSTYLAGEPIFCNFSIHNTGSRPFAFTYRNPTRIPNPELESEPRFKVRDAAGGRVADPAPERCGGAKGTAVYGSVTLPPGQVHTERWLLNQWARFSRVGKYRVRAERRLPLRGAQQEFSGPPLAHAVALNELSLEIVPSNEEQLRAVFEPYRKWLRSPDAREFPEAVQAVTTLPRLFLLDDLAMLARAPAGERRWDREQILQGLARLGTPAAWDVILKIAVGPDIPTETSQEDQAGKEDPLRAYAVLLLAEKGEARFLAPILSLLPRTTGTLRGEILRALGFFRDARASAALFEALRSPQTDDRINAILGLRNLGTREVIPALIARLSDPEAQVRQVAHFALRNLTGQSIALSATALPAESVRVAGEWRAWWQKQSPDFTPVRPPPCRDW